jgi:hypothetical protein
MGLKTKNNYPGEEQQQFSSQSVERALSCIIRHRYEAATSEDIADRKDIVFAVLIFIVCRSVNYYSYLYLRVISAQ